MILYGRDFSILSKTKALVFDVDGVIVDVNGSFRKMIILAVNYYFRLKLGLKGKGFLVTNEAIEKLKQLGGFNNDWDLTAVLIYLYLNLFFYKGKPSTIEKLKLKSKELTSLLNLLSADLKDVSYEAMLKKIKKHFGKNHAEAFFDRALIDDICKTLYAGKETFQVYGKITTIDKSLQNKLMAFELFKKEKKLLNEDYLKENLVYGLVTGRTRGELFLLKDTFPRLFSLVANIIYDEPGFPRKPDPEVLKFYIEKNMLPLVFVGDSRDDLETVRNVRKYYKVNDVFYCGVVKDKKSFEFYRSLGADFLTNDINMFLLAAGNE